MRRHYTLLLASFLIILSVANVWRSFRIPWSSDDVLPDIPGDEFPLSLSKAGNSSQPSSTARGKTPIVVLIHVGKTGGETVRQNLLVTCRQRRNPTEKQKCLDQFRSNSTIHINETIESSLSKHTIGTMHCDLLMPKKSLERATVLLWTLRSPLERVVSWFRVMNPANCRPHQDYLSTACNTNRSIISHYHNAKRGEKQKGSLWYIKFFGCFSSINQFAEALDVVPHEAQTEKNNCTDLAWRTIRGKASPSSGHIFFNYRYYWSQTLKLYPHLESWVIRTDRLWQDVDHIEALLRHRPKMGQTKGKGITHQHHGKRNVTHGSEGHLQKEELTAFNRRRLGCALVDELHVYGTLLLGATNLEENAKKTTLSQVAKDCGEDSWESLLEQMTACEESASITDV